MISPNQIKINICKYVGSPLNLALICRNWTVIAKDPFAKTEWLIIHYGKAHALFHALRLGPPFINVPEKLIELKIEHNVGQLDTDRIQAFQQKIKSSWASNLSIFGFTYLLDEGYKQLANANATKVELFHFLSADPHVINYAPGMLKKHLNDILDFFSPRQNALNSFGFLQQECFLRQQCLSPSSPLTVPTPFTNNVGIFGARPSRSVGQRGRQSQNNQLRRRQRHQPNARRRQLNARRQRIYRRRQPNAPINNDDTLNRIVNLPRQQVSNDPLINQFFNGSSFI